MLHNLESEIRERCHRLRGTAGVVVQAVQGSATVESTAATPTAIHVDPALVFPAASLIKLPILWEYALQVEAGELPPEHQVTLAQADQVGGSGILKLLTPGTRLAAADLATLMIVLSDNTASNMLVDLLGLERIQRTIAALPLPATRLQRKLMDYEAKRAGRDNVTSPADIAHLLRHFLTSPQLPPPARGRLVETLKQQQVRHKLPAGMPPDVELAHKTGEQEGVEHDAGILFTLSGPVVVVVMCRDLQDNQEGVELIRQVGRLVYEAWP